MLDWHAPVSISDANNKILAIQRHHPSLFPSFPESRRHLSELLACDPLKAVPVPSLGLLDDLVGQADSLLGLLALLDQPVPYKLLVERLLRPTGNVLVRRPVPRRVGREDLVDEDERPVRGGGRGGRGGSRRGRRGGEEAELKLGVGEDETDGGGVGGGRIWVEWSGASGRCGKGRCRDEQEDERRRAGASVRNKGIDVRWGKAETRQVED